ncbi:5-methyltetrahydropteroyltriglutamate--homocysteine S-methyltransferase, metE [Lactococcus cremoris]|uniref:5-methyltetrahydropteroyltriglutamate--homocysteine methyltransferase n=1 Tax=Lactococcus cremoris subsp. cremoris IBB477 TaxID=1449093 RepID=A0A1E7G463_LACLC|nr:5-methyltetrahydropteroyltriglutamate--homocysteine S-methyltransferase [Lactococcus cremoris]KKW72967.1 5-methyltetrahydropteroyltriglutamate--homocysteine S-methyltransferase, metE [Lactococcus cremoris]MCT0455868.1 5-methyltetrahydropteroyltriglutamate--homocysteine S-methyltransferase [Lactococcus cremoris]MCT0477198.1 5-methyltetrahydropteroyltriglutamate--homocysteine S-methyltransferase [Lactococcus cremoris]MCT0500790.1 5-methyltetrahydropteroyltriglutamate--homocysteine S-methyltran
MKKSIIAFPRIGSNRELKFALEKYFRKEISEAELQIVAKELRLESWKSQKEAGIDYPISNDFSFYDQTLDLSIALGVIPERYKKLKLNELDTLFALARGFQDEENDVKARPMKKWFNTNYHYIVPEISKETVIKANFSKLLNEYQEAKTAGFETRPTIIGPYTFLILADYLSGVTEDAILSDLIGAYTILFDQLNNLGGEWLQIEEPALVLDQTEEEQQLFIKIYQELLKNKNKLKVLLQTYFGDLRDSYQEIIKLNFDGIGLDFVEGRESLKLVQKYGFPKDKLLFAGVVNGKNIWRNHYQKTLSLLKDLGNIDNIVINTSCSLQHVPVTTENETKLSKEILNHFAFAKEKLVEVSEISEIYVKKNTSLLDKNIALFDKNRVQENIQLKQKIAHLTDKDFIRTPSLVERRADQIKALKLPLLPTTTIGSFPQTPEVRKSRLQYKRGELSKSDYEAFLEEKIKECLELQENIGLDVLVHGEFERNDMVEYFGEQLDGYIFTQKAWVQSYGTRCVKPPIVWGDITRPQAMTVRWSAYAQSQTSKPVKGMLTGPVTILNWSFPREDISLKESTLQLALAVQEEVLDLEKAGIKIIQIDEAALREKLPLRRSDWYSEYLDWAIPAFRLVHSKVKAETQIHTHMCYSEFEDIIPSIDAMDADVISFEASRSQLSIIDALKAHHFQTLVGPGVYDIHSPRIPSSQEIKIQLEKILNKLPIEQVWVNPDCGLKTRGNKETIPSLTHLVEATKEVRKEKITYDK